MYNTDMPTRAELPTTAQLVRSTIFAILAAAAILITIVLPAEYAIDPTGIGKVLRLTEMGEIKTQLADEAAKDRELDQQKQTPAAPLPDKRSNLLQYILAELFVSSANAQAVEKSDETKVTLKQNEGAEIKLTMRKSAKVKYSWVVSGGTVNFDMHGDSKGKETSYKKGRDAPKDDGVLVAGYDGAHGWFWRNRGKSDVTITLRTTGEYTEVKRVK